MTPVLIEAAPHKSCRVGSPAFETSMAAPAHGDLRDFLAYWQSKCRDGQLPLRADIDPIDIPKLLPNVLLIDVIGQPAHDFVYRLLGTTIVDIDGVDFKGSLLSEMVPTAEAFHHIWQHHLDAAAGIVELRYDTMRWVRDNSRGHIDYLILLLPLRRGGNEIQTLFGYIHYLMDDLHRPWTF